MHTGRMHLIIWAYAHGHLLSTNDYCDVVDSTLTEMSHSFAFEVITHFESKLSEIVLYMTCVKCVLCWVSDSLLHHKCSIPPDFLRTYGLLHHVLWEFPTSDSYITGRPSTTWAITWNVSMLEHVTSSRPGGNHLWPTNDGRSAQETACDHKIFKCVRLFCPLSGTTQCRWPCARRGSYLSPPWPIQMQSHAVVPSWWLWRPDSNQSATHIMWPSNTLRAFWAPAALRARWKKMDGL